MTSILECKNSINSYNALKSKINSIVINLDKYNDVDDKLMLKISQNYIIDNDTSFLYDRINDLSNDVSRTSNYLKYTVIPAIDNAIKNEQSIIADLQAAEEAQRAKEQAELEAQKARIAAEEAQRAKEQAELEAQRARIAAEEQRKIQETQKALYSEKPTQNYHTNTVINDNARREKSRFKSFDMDVM